ncbi:hypothetical protein GS399_01890 [Pedobacter sp. HMF7647]|uniref:DUF4595 domain-containing protein n=1 Tax=Hufsiella arboris TaxID=2695275 RepID=A0A7K1Y544_9SPHI|nr:hypothetical protein [Hufsiella arboris]MXV49705.1 hypothetical protein [Hufsiella arboris]
MKPVSICLASALLIVACKKNKEGAIIETESCKVNTFQPFVRDYDSGVKEFFKYDSKERITRIDYNKANSTSFKTIKYDSDKITTYFEELRQNGYLNTFRDTVYLDNSGQIQRLSGLYDEYFFDYDASGYLISVTIKSGDVPYQTVTFHSFKYNNGNLNKIETKFTTYTTKLRRLQPKSSIQMMTLIMI